MSCRQAIADVGNQKRKNPGSARDRTGRIDVLSGEKLSRTMRPHIPSNALEAANARLAKENCIDATKEHVAKIENHSWEGKKAGGK